MRRFFTLLAVVLIALTAYCTDFVNTYFKGSIETPTGAYAYMYLEFKDAGKGIITMKLPGMKMQRQNMTWSDDSRCVKVVEPGGEQHFFGINYEQKNGSYEPYLILDSPYGTDVDFLMISEEQYNKETKSSTAASRKTTTTPRKKRR